MVSVRRGQGCPMQDMVPAGFTAELEQGIVEPIHKVCDAFVKTHLRKNRNRKYLRGGGAYSTEPLCSCYITNCKIMQVYLKH